MTVKSKKKAHSPFLLTWTDSLMRTSLSVMFEKHAASYVMASNTLPASTRESTHGDPMRLVSPVYATMLSRCPSSCECVAKDERTNQTIT